MSAMSPIQRLSDQLLQLIFGFFAHVDTKTLLTVVPAVCRRWREVCGQTRNVHLDSRFVPSRAAVRVHAGDESGARMLCEIVKRMAHIVGLHLGGFQSLTDASVVALAEHCMHLISVKFVSCVRITDASVLALAENCPHLTNADFNFCEHLTDASVVALAEHCPHLTSVQFWRCEQLTDTSVVALAEHCPHLTHIDFGGCSQLTDLCEQVLAKCCPRAKLSR